MQIIMAALFTSKNGLVVKVWGNTFDDGACPPTLTAARSSPAATHVHAFHLQHTGVVKIAINQEVAVKELCSCKNCFDADGECSRHP